MSFVHIYHLNTQLVTGINSAYWDCLNKADWQRVGALKRDIDQQTRQLAYATVYWLLQAHSGVSVTELKLNYDTFGKPFISHSPSQPMWHFNISHSGQQIALVLAQVPVGIDIERHQDIDAYGLATHYFPTDSWVKGDLVSFYQLWVCKEALLKAQGMGLRVEPASVVLRKPSKNFVGVQSAPATLQLEQYAYALIDCPERHSCAVAVHGQNAALKVQTLELTQLHALSRLKNFTVLH